MLDIMALELILLVLIDVRCTHSHFKEYKLKGNEFFFFFNSKGNRVGSLHLGYSMVMKTS